MASPVRKAVFPVAGLARRLLPATKAVAKELLPVAGRPLIQYAVDEAKAAGITEFIFVAGRNLDALRAYFSRDPILEDALKARGADEEVALLQSLEIKNAHFIRQEESQGLGHAIFCAREAVGDAPFAVLLPDDLIKAKPGALAQMMAARVRGHMVAIEDVPAEETARYGIITPGTRDGALVQVKGLVEKPEPKDAPSSLAIVGRYILEPSIFAALEKTKPGAGGEIQITDALIIDSFKTTPPAPLAGFAFTGRRYDCGALGGMVEANTDFMRRTSDVV